MIVCTYEADIVANLEAQTGLPVVSVARVFSTQKITSSPCGLWAKSAAFPSGQRK